MFVIKALEALTGGLQIHMKENRVLREHGALKLL